MAAKRTAPIAKPATPTRRPKALAVPATQGLGTLGQPGGKPSSGVSTWTARNLTPTGADGVFLNAEGIEVDKSGVAIEFKRAQYRDTERLESALGGKITTPAELLKAIALDGTLPLPMRLDAATRAAPYFDRKQPTRVETEEVPSTPFSAEQLAKLGDKELEQLWSLLDKLGLTDGLGPAAPTAKARGNAAPTA